MLKKTVSVIIIVIGILLILVGIFDNKVPLTVTDPRTLDESVIQINDYWKIRHHSNGAIYKSLLDGNLYLQAGEG